MIDGVTAIQILGALGAGAVPALLALFVVRLLTYREPSHRRRKSPEADSEPISWRPL